MAVNPRRGGGGGGSVILIIVTILIILGLIAGYIPVVLAFDPYVRAVVDLNDLIEENVYEPLRQGGVPVRKQTITAEQKTPFDRDIMLEAKQHIEMGVQYDSLVSIVGWEGVRALGEIEDMLKQAHDVLGRHPASVRDFVEQLRLAYRKAQTDKASLSSDLQKASDEADAHRKALDEALQEVRNLEQRAQADIVAERQKKEEEIKGLAEFNDRLNADLQTARQSLNEARRTARREREAWNEREAELRQRIVLLEDRLAREEPVEILPVEGEIHSADMLREYAIVSLGEQHGMRIGDTVRIYRVGRGGIRILKATGRVVSVQRFISRVDLFDLDRQYPVIEGDVVVPERMLNGE